MKQKSAAATYTLKVTLSGAVPPIWRRFEVPAAVTLHQLHQILQIVMGWTDSHLHQFERNGVVYGERDPEFGLERVDEAKTLLADVLRRSKNRLRYEYDFGDGWQHEVVLVSSAEANVPAPPRVVAAKGACPPEDVGGLGGYENFLDAMADPKHPEHAECREWWGGQFDPQAYDLEEASAMLKAMRLRLVVPKTRPRGPAVRPSAADDRFLKKLGAKLEDPAAILNDREVAFLKDQMIRAVPELARSSAAAPAMAEDVIRWEAVRARCGQARKARGLTIKDAARSLRVPQKEIRNVENGPASRGFPLETAVLYFRLLGIEPWVARWARANPELARRLKLR